MSGEVDLGGLLRTVTDSGENAPGIDDRLGLLQTMRNKHRGASTEIDRLLLGEIHRLRANLEDVKHIQQRLKEVFEQLKGAPWYPAVFTGFQKVNGRVAAVVICGGALRVVPLVDTLDADALSVGDEVLLGNEMNLVVARSTALSFRSGEIGLFDRFTPDARIVIKCRDEEMVVDVAAGLRSVELRTGDRVRWDRSVWVAYEKLERSDDHPLFLEETPVESFEQVGGLDSIIRRLQQSVLLHMDHKELVRKYHLIKRAGILFCGPPGNGKTMMARALANWVGTIAPAGRARFMHIKPGALHSMWYSASEANYREAFRAAREAGEAEPDVPVVMFFDEIDAVGAARGTSLMRVDDRVQTALMAELDGLESRGNILVVAATNRRDALDPALVRPGRLGDLVLDIPRPNRKGARAIFDRCLPPDLPYDINGHGGADAARETIVEGALARIYGHGPECDLATVTFRDGKQRTVRARDLISGAAITKVVGVALERACIREKDTGSTGIRESDVLEAVFEECTSAVGVLTPSNCRSHLADLPQDVDVVRIEAVRPRVAPERYLSPVA